ncbi:hypothetical protein V2G26_007041 [Clonostachys chloroleuca]
MWPARNGVCVFTYSFGIFAQRGSQHAIVVLGKGRGFNFEDLAPGQANILAVANKLTRFALLALSTFWILLITAAGLKKNTWFLLAVGAVGILQNVYVSGASRRPENFGIPLTFVEAFGKTSVMETLLDVERKYKHIGRALLREFFPGDLRDNMKKWKELESPLTKPINQEVISSADPGDLSS